VLEERDCDILANTTNGDSSWAWAAGATQSTLDDLHRWAPVAANGTG
jgi:hypothetical protein